jgi:hypothetical protein
VCWCTQKRQETSHDLRLRQGDDTLLDPLGSFGWLGLHPLWLSGPPRLHNRTEDGVLAAKAVREDECTQCWRCVMMELLKCAQCGDRPGLLERAEEVLGDE